MISIDNIQALIDHNHTLTAWCHECRHSKVLDLHKLGKKLGFNHSTLHDDLTPKLKCTRCGSKKIGLLVAKGEEFGVNPMAGSSN